jgi:competence protein ComEA
MFRLTRQEQFTIGALVLLVAAVIVVITVGRRPREPGVPVEIAVNTDPVAGVQSSREVAAGGPTIVVHVAGEVEAPGTYELPRGARVSDAVQKAKPTSGADVNALNLAAVLFDGQKIVVPPHESSPRVLPRESENTPTEGGPIDLNSATQTELETLPGIGPARAADIVAYRQEHPFRRIEDVMKVPGIGPGIFERIKDRIIVR